MKKLILIISIFLFLSIPAFGFFIDKNKGTSPVGTELIYSSYSSVFLPTTKSELSYYYSNNLRNYYNYKKVSRKLTYFSCRMN